jgi:hypothetical protein
MPRMIKGIAVLRGHEKLVFSKLEGNPLALLFGIVKPLMVNSRLKIRVDL